MTTLKQLKENKDYPTEKYGMKNGDDFKVMDRDHPHYKREGHIISLKHDGNNVEVLYHGASAGKTAILPVTSLEAI